MRESNDLKFKCLLESEMKTWRQRMCLHLWIYIKKCIGMLLWFNVFLTSTQTYAAGIFAWKCAIKSYLFQVSWFEITSYVHHSFLKYYVIIRTLFHLLCCHSSLCGYPQRLQYSTLTSTKAGTVCLPEAPCRPTMPEVRNKENISLCSLEKDEL